MTFDTPRMCAGLRVARNIGVAAAATLVGFGAAPAEAAFTSSIRFQADSFGLTSPMDFGPASAPSFSSSSTLSCPLTTCLVSTTGGLFTGATSYGTIPVSYEAGGATGDAVNFSKPFTGVFTPSNSFTILGGASPIIVTLLDNPFTGGLVNTNAESGVTKNIIPILPDIAARVQIGNTLYSSATVTFNAYSEFDWGASVNTASASNVWVFVDEDSATVPSPLPILGASAAFGWTRKLRRRIGRVA